MLVLSEKKVKCTSDRVGAPRAPSNFRRSTTSANFLRYVFSRLARRFKRNIATHVSNLPKIVSASSSERDIPRKS